jgi:tRNA A-37 threonylcarbamoyl transferase component Bud32
VRSEEDPSLKLLESAPQERLDSWLKEFYGRPVAISKREILRHRDLSCVERLWIANSLPASIIYKQVLPPWDIEQDILERVLIPSISNSAQLYLSANHGSLTALFLEDVGSQSLVKSGDMKLACTLGKDLAKMHRAYIYRVDELMQTGILKAITPIDYLSLTESLINQLNKWQLLQNKDSDVLLGASQTIAKELSREPISLVHGDYYAENIIFHSKRLYVIDWSWFTAIGVPLLDLATITSNHVKNGELIRFKQEIIEAYCDESARQVNDIIKLLPFAQALSRLLFLSWLVERKSRGIEGTTVGPVDNLILQVVQSIKLT